ncbi:MAG TPA: DUF1674 domain-containing protein [Burkholderiaceae bacterium]|nr:DUF1674 domain-containing protein [Burkholderiaceae bacterium]
MRTTSAPKSSPATDRDQSRSSPEPASPLDSGGREWPTPEGDDLDPTRYGDWEKNGRCIDF